jgi:hypothetical protein
MADAEANVLELPLTLHFRAFEAAFKDAWGNNADAMSLLYRSVTEYFSFDGNRG